jgi:hypothetical protein
LNNLHVLKKIIEGLSAFAIGVALALFGTGSRITSFTVGPLTVSAWITVIVPVCFAVMLTLIVIFIARQTGIRSYGNALLAAGTSPWFIFLFASYSIVTLASHWRIEGAQNLLAFGLFALGIFAWGMAIPQKKVSLLWDVAVYIALAHSIFVMFTHWVEWNVIDQRSFAMTAVIGLAAAVTVPAKNVFLRLAPYGIFLSIVFSSSRTATFAALIMIGLVALRSPVRGRHRILGIIIAYGFGIASILLTYSLYSPAKSRLIAGDEAIKVPSLPLPDFFTSSGKSVETATAFVINSNGRFEAWAEFLGLLRTPADWIFGLGPGASAEYGGKNLTYFSQVLNEYLRLLVDSGILGLSLFLIAMVGLVVTIMRSQQIPWQYRLGALLTLFSLAVVSSTDGAFIYPFSSLPAGLLVGLALSFLFRARGISVQSTAPEPAVSVANL